MINQAVMQLCWNMKVNEAGLKLIIEFILLNSKEMKKMINLLKRFGNEFYHKYLNKRLVFKNHDKLAQIYDIIRGIEL